MWVQMYDHNTGQLRGPITYCGITTLCVASRTRGKKHRWKTRERQHMESLGYGGSLTVNY